MGTRGKRNKYSWLSRERCAVCFRKVGELIEGIGEMVNSNQGDTKSASNLLALLHTLSACTLVMPMDRDLNTSSASVQVK